MSNEPYRKPKYTNLFQIDGVKSADVAETNALKKFRKLHEDEEPLDLEVTVDQHQTRRTENGPDLSPFAGMDEVWSGHCERGNVPVTEEMRGKSMYLILETTYSVIIRAYEIPKPKKQD